MFAPDDRFGGAGQLPGVGSLPLDGGMAAAGLGDYSGWNDLHSPLPPPLPIDDTFTTHAMDAMQQSPEAMGFMQQTMQQQQQQQQQAPFPSAPPTFYDQRTMPPPPHQRQSSIPQAQQQQYQQFQQFQQYQQQQQQQQQQRGPAMSPPQQHQQQPPHPPRHLFASANSPFATATFEVEGDLNGVNPSVAAEQAYMRRTQGAQTLHSPTPPGQSRQQQQQPLYGLAPDNLFRSATGDSQSGMFAQQESPIGLLPQQLQQDQLGMMGAPMPQQPLGGASAAYDSLIDRAEQAAQGSRKRARGSMGVPMAPMQPQMNGMGAMPAGLGGVGRPGAIDLSAEDEPRSLEASTFAVFGPASAGVAGQGGPIAADRQLQHMLQAQQAHRAGSAHPHAAAPVTTTPPSAAAGSIRRGPSSVAPSQASSGGDSPHGDDGASVMANQPKEEQKKVKHQLTDRQRRAKIKESMDALKALVPLDASQKADQATIVASSVTLVQSLKDEVQQLREKLHAMELRETQEAGKYDARKSAITQHQQGHMHRGGGAAAYHPEIPLLSNSPFTSMMASLNGAGVSMWRLGLHGQILEVNLVFELVSGFSAREVIGSTPCHPPMFGSLSIMPAAFLKAFSQVSSVPQINPSPYYQKHPPLQPDGTVHAHHRHSSGNASGVSTPPELDPRAPGSSSSAGSSSATHSGDAATPVTAASPLTPQEQAAATATGCASDPCAGGNGVDGPIKIEVDEGNTSVNPTSTAQGGSASQTSVAPLYANASISNFPIVPQAELQNFFPYKCRSLIDAAGRSGVTQPQPHGNFLVNHLSALPPNHVLKLLCRHHTLWGEILESIVTLCLIRDAKGDPDYIMILSTPDCRRLLTPATHHPSPFMGVGGQAQRATVDTFGEGDATMHGEL